MKMLFSLVFRLGWPVSSHRPISTTIKSLKILENACFQDLSIWQPGKEGREVEMRYSNLQLWELNLLDANAASLEWW